jgi:hypothetical protein
MAKRFIRLDVMSGNKDNTQVKSAKYFKDDAVAPVENGTIVAIGGLLDGEREIHKVTDVTAESTYVGIVSTPEVEYEERGNRGIETFANEADAAVRVHVLHEGDIFSIANLDSKEDLACGAKLVAKHIQTEVVGRFTYEVFEVQAK